MPRARRERARRTRPTEHPRARIRARARARRWPITRGTRQCRFGGGGGTGGEDGGGGTGGGGTGGGGGGGPAAPSTCRPIAANRPPSSSQAVPVWTSRSRPSGRCCSRTDVPSPPCVPTGYVRTPPSPKDGSSEPSSLYRASANEDSAFDQPPGDGLPSGWIASEGRRRHSCRSTWSRLRFRRTSCRGFRHRDKRDEANTAASRFLRSRPRGSSLRSSARPLGSARPRRRASRRFRRSRSSDRAGRPRGSERLRSLLAPVPESVVPADDDPAAVERDRERFVAEGRVSDRGSHDPPPEPNDWIGRPVGRFSLTTSNPLYVGVVATATIFPSGCTTRAEADVLRAEVDGLDPVAGEARIELAGRRVANESDVRVEVGPPSVSDHDDRSVRPDRHASRPSRAPGSRSIGVRTIPLDPNEGSTAPFASRRTAKKSSSSS